MTKTELQSALAEATQTDKRTAGVFLNTLSALAYKEIKKNGEFVLPGFGKLVKQKRKARTGFNPKPRAENPSARMTRLRLIENVRSRFARFIDLKVVRQTLEGAHQNLAGKMAVPGWPKESGIATN
jgi:nucleoid DNA-binding protein